MAQAHNKQHASPTPRLILCAHGTRGVAGVVGQHARDLARTPGVGPVEVGSLYGTPRLEAILDRLYDAPARLVPFMMAEGYTYDRLRERVDAHSSGAGVTITRPVGVHPDLSDLIADRAQVVCQDAGWHPTRTALMLVGHGTPRHAASRRSAQAHARRIAARHVFSQVATAFIDDTPSVAEAARRLRAPACVAVGFLTDAGNHGADDVPDLLAHIALPARYAGPIGPQAPMLRLILAHILGDSADVSTHTLIDHQHMPE